MYRSIFRRVADEEAQYSDEEGYLPDFGTVLYLITLCPLHSYFYLISISGSSRTDYEEVTILKEQSSSELKYGHRPSPLSFKFLPLGETLRMLCHLIL